MYRITEHLDRYPNGEWYPIKPLTPEPKCRLLGDLSTHENLYATLYLARTLKAAGATEIELIAPYIPYLRQDHRESGDIGALFLGELCRASGVTRILTLDPHSRAAEELLSLPCLSRSAIPALLNAIDMDRRAIDTIIIPDYGARVRISREYLNIDGVHIIAADKTRRVNTITTSLPENPKSGAHVAIIDDMLDTGRTLVATVEALAACQPSSITIIITHGLFTSDVWKSLLEAPDLAIYCTDSHPGVLKAAKDYPEIFHIIPALLILTDSNNR